MAPTRGALRIDPALRRLDRMIWAATAVVTAVVLAAPAISSFSLDWSTFVPPALATLALAAGAWLYRNRRPEPQIAAALENTAQLIAFAMVAAPLSYLAAATDLPLQDYVLDTADRALGLDWRALLNWMNAAPTIYAALHPIYLSLTLQMTAAVLGLAFTGRLLRLRIYMLAFILAALITIAISAVAPAAGAWPYYALSAADSPHVTPAVNTSWPVFYGLRDGSLRVLVATGAEGIISFPSLHAALAVMLMIALWPIPILRWVIFALDAAMLAATPIEGSHYFTDVFAGIAVGIMCFAAAGLIAARAKQTRGAPASVAIANFAAE